jgi:hypothetical protein
VAARFPGHVPTRDSRVPEGVSYGGGGRVTRVANRRAVKLQALEVTVVNVDREFRFTEAISLRQLWPNRSRPVVGALSNVEKYASLPSPVEPKSRIREIQL